MEGKLGYNIDHLMPIKLIYLVRNELTLSKPETFSLSRIIGFPNRARILEFSSNGRGAVLQYLVIGSSGP